MFMTSAPNDVNKRKLRSSDRQIIPIQKETKKVQKRLEFVQRNDADNTKRVSKFLLAKLE